MATKRVRPDTDPTDRSRLVAEIANEPQWVVWPDADHEAAWVDEVAAVDWAAAAARATHHH